MIVVNCCTELLVALILGIIAIGSFDRSRKNRKGIKYFPSVVICTFLLNASMGFYHLGYIKGWDNLIREMLGMVGIVSYYLVLFFFSKYINYYVFEGGKLGKTLGIVSGVICAVSAMTWLYYLVVRLPVFEDRFQMHFTGFYFLGQAGGVLVLLGCFCVCVEYYIRTRDKEAFSLMLFMFFPVIVFVLRCFFPMVTLLYQAMGVSVVVIFVFIQSQSARRLAMQDRDLFEKNQQIIISQLKPHFLYNVLNSIYYLCEKSPDDAQQEIAEFAEYLRGNLDSIESGRMVTAQKELEHLEHYLHLEKMRFGEDLKIAYDIRTTDFMIPPLTIQPIAENAIKHGITRKLGGGTLLIRTERSPEGVRIVVKDDGLGFDPDRMPEDGKTHMGIENVRSRLKMACGGTLQIRSREGEGTEVTILLKNQ